MTELELLIARELAFGTHLRFSHALLCGGELEAVDCERVKEHIEEAQQVADEYIKALTDG